MVGPNSSSKSAQCGQWKSSYKVIVTGASGGPSGMGRSLVIVTGLADAGAEGVADGDLLVRQAWNPIPTATTITTKAATIAIKMRRSRLRAAACSAASRARSRALMLLGPLMIKPGFPLRRRADPGLIDCGAASSATRPVRAVRYHEGSPCRTRSALGLPHHPRRNTRSRYLALVLRQLRRLQ